jgi:hypothetical protein
VTNNRTWAIGWPAATRALLRTPRGVAEGRQQARTVLASRTGDGLDPASVNAPFARPRHQASGSRPRRPSAPRPSTATARPSHSFCALPTSTGPVPRLRSTRTATVATWPRYVPTARSAARPVRRLRRTPPPSRSGRRTCSTPSHCEAHWQGPPGGHWLTGPNWWRCSTSLRWTRRSRPRTPSTPTCVGARDPRD